MTNSASYRWSVASRVGAAAVGGYGLTSAATVLLSLVLPFSKANAVATASMLSFALYTFVIVWVFSTRSAIRAWLWIVGTTAILGALCYLLAQGAT